MVRAAAAALIGGIGMGLIWSFINLQIRIGGLFFVIILGFGLSYAFVRVMEFATGSKRGPVVVAFAVAGMLVAWSVLVGFVGFDRASPGLIAVAAGWYFAYQSLK